jgi:hypothetical protein
MLYVQQYLASCPDEDNAVVDDMAHGESPHGVSASTKELPPSL